LDNEEAEQKLQEVEQALLEKKRVAVGFSVSVLVPRFEGKLALVEMQPQGGLPFEV